MSNIILVDMDNTKVDYSALFEQRLQERLPKEAFLTRNLEKYWIEESFEAQYHEAIHQIMREKGFFLDMQPMEGAIESIYEMINAGLQVVFVTTPHPGSEFCINEKILWVRQHLGEEYVTSMIFANDKTLVSGAVLIDDKPEIVGLNPEPTWTHVLFSAPYNKHVLTKHRLDHWRDWQKVVYPILEQKQKSPE